MMKSKGNRLRKIATISRGLFQKPKEVKGGLSRIYNDVILAYSPITSLSAVDFLGEHVAVTLENFLSVEGNVTLEELVFISALSRKLQPRIVVEIGTFDGNTALQLALNTPPETRIYTLDLPLGHDSIVENDPADTKYVSSSRRRARRFLGSPVEHKIVQCYGNSLTYDFAHFTANGKPQFIFVDAGHSYECVRNDSEKALAILDRGGTIVWQDYSAQWPGVLKYLAELSNKLPLIHIAGTTLVIYNSPE
jgi:Methyltransferase domain